jgi:hypothetical protein
MLAAEKARRLAREGFRTLLVCFNQPLATMLAAELADAGAPGGGLDVLTFHELCLRLGRAYGLLPKPEPTEKGNDWFEKILPAALEAAIGEGRDPYHAIVVDEGQDFERSWLESLDLLLSEPGEGVFYVFHDPGQALYRDDVVESLGLLEFSVGWNCRNPVPIHAFAARHAAELADVSVLRERGRAPELIEAAPGREAIEALRKVLHRLVVEERVAREQIVVLTGRSLAKSDIWRERRFGNQVLWNGSYDDAGHSLGLSADEAPEQPSDSILFDSIRRFKGLERGRRAGRAGAGRRPAGSAVVCGGHPGAGALGGRGDRIGLRRQSLAQAICGCASGKRHRRLQARDVVCLTRKSMLGVGIGLSPNAGDHEMTSH